MYRWLRRFCVLSIWVVLVVASAHAVTHRFSVAVEADSLNLGTATGVLEITPKADGRVTWKLTEGQFTAATLADGKMLWDDAILSGTGDADAGATVIVKDFTATIEKTSGVDVAYRFRLSATMEKGEIKDVTIKQQT